MSFDVSVLIVTYNSEQQIVGCLESLREQRVSVTQQVVVVDNASSDRTVDVIRTRFPEVELVLPGKNLGFAAGVNLAARHAKAGYLLLLNPDTVILDHAVDKIVEFARKHPAYGLYGGRTLKDDGSVEPSSCWDLPSLWSLTMFATGLSAIGRNNRWLDPESLGSWPRDTVREVGIITGCFLLISREAWDRLQGFDERYFMYGEDADLALRARLAGYRPVIYPLATLSHEIGSSSATPLHKALLLFRGKACFVRTRWRGLRRNLALALLVAGVGLRALAGNVVRSTNATWPALWQRRHEWLPGYPTPAQSRSSTPQ
jgi:N-acetylglucosaminyl-diphospho-decaprenol L-rhamnosyltransferase